METLPWPSQTFLLFYLFAYNMIKCICNMHTMQQRAAKNLTVSVTYQGWLGHLCGLLLLAAHHMKAMRPQDRCTAVAPPSPPFCSGDDERWLAVETWINVGHTFACVNKQYIRRACMLRRKSLTVGGACAQVADGLKFEF